MKRILVALDQSPRAVDVLARASAIAKATGAQLYLFHAVGLPSGIPADAFRASPNELVEIWKLEAVRDLERRAGSVDPVVVTHVLVHIGQPWASICAAARENDVDLIVIGSHGHEMLDRVLGTTAAKVVNHADRSVLVVRSPTPGASV
jgi:nucleotide-binding universal stress UspA family protein